MALIKELSGRVLNLSKYMESIEIRKSCSELRAIWTLGNEYLQNAEPWKIFKVSPSNAGSVMNFSFNLIYLYSVISEPFIPATCTKISKALNFPSDTSWPADLDTFLRTVKGGHKFSVPENLFQKISDEQKQSFADKFSGAISSSPTLRT